MDADSRVRRVEEPQVVHERHEIGWRTRSLDVLTHRARLTDFVAVVVVIRTIWVRLADPARILATTKTMSLIVPDLSDEFASGIAGQPD